MEKLAGKLRWERTANGIRIEIPGWMGIQTLFFFAWLAFWTFGGWQVTRAFLKSGELFLILWLVGWAAGELMVGRTILWSFFGQTILTLDSTALNVTQVLAGINLRSRSVPTNDVRNLRYRPVDRRGWKGMSGVICFESGERTHKFASGISDAEAFALIDKMLEVYSFPKERALEYLDLSR